MPPKQQSDTGKYMYGIRKALPLIMVGIPLAFLYHFSAIIIVTLNTSSYDPLVIAFFFRLADGTLLKITSTLILTGVVDFLFGKKLNISNGTFRTSLIIAILLLFFSTMLIFSESQIILEPEDKNTVFVGENYVNVNIKEEAMLMKYMSEKFQIPDQYKEKVSSIRDNLQDNNEARFQLLIFWLSILYLVHIKVTHYGKRNES